MTISGKEKTEVLVVSVGARACALPLQDVGETMRALPVESFAGMPSFVLGLSIIRGAPTPVVNLGALVGSPRGSHGRMVTLRSGERPFAIAVESVLGVRWLDRSLLQTSLALFHECSSDLVEAIGTLDAKLLLLLRAGWVLPNEVWLALANRESR